MSRPVSRGVSRVGLGGLAVALLISACAPAPELDRAQMHEWVEVLYPLPKVERLSPPVAARMLSYAGLALYEGLQNSDPDMPSLGGRLRDLPEFPAPGPGPHDWSVVAAEAERLVLSGLLNDYALPSTMVQIDTIAEGQIARRAAAGVTPETIDRSRDFAVSIARVILERADRDGFTATRRRPYDPPVGEGIWVNTTTLEEYAPISASEASQFVRRDNPSAALVPGSANARQMLLDRPSSTSEPVGNINPLQPLEPYWMELETWGLESITTCAPPPPVEWSSDPDSEFREQVMAVYDASNTLTEEQRIIALFWADNPGSTGTPPGHWVAIMRQMIAQLDMDPMSAARMFGYTSLAMHDAFVSTWYEKYRSNVVRPVTYIREYIDPNWETVVVTPPFPEYTSGHSVVSGAAAQSLTEILGDVAFADSTHISAGLAPRSFANFQEAADEAAISRLYGGIHYPMAIDDGVAQGRCIATNLLDRISVVPAGM